MIHEYILYFRLTGDYLGMFHILNVVEDVAILQAHKTSNYKHHLEYYEKVLSHKIVTITLILVQ